MADPKIQVAIWMALKARVMSLSLSPSVPVLWPGQITEPEARHIVASQIVAAPSRVTISDGPHERVGTLQLLLKHPVKAVNYEATQELAGTISDHFASGLRLKYKQACVHITSAPHVSDGFRDDTWWVTPIRIRWRCAG